MKSMKRLMACLLLLASGIAAEAAQASMPSPVYCADITGTWTTNNSDFVSGATGTATWSLTQDNTHNPALISGTISNFPNGEGGYTTWTLNAGTSGQSAAVGSGQFDIYAENAEFGTNMGKVVTIAKGTIGCASGTMGSGLGTAAITINACMKPNGAPNAGESTTFTQWVPSGADYGTAQYHNILFSPPSTSAGYDWSGRSVQEAFSNWTTSPAACYISIDPPLNPSTWNINDGYSSLDNHSYEDFVGLEYGILTNIQMGIRRLHGPIPCGVTMTQTMSIDCPGANGAVSWQSYSVNADAILINASTIHVKRNGVNSPTDETFGFTKGSASNIINGTPSTVRKTLGF